MVNKVYSVLIKLKINHPCLAPTYKVNNNNHCSAKDKVNCKLKVCLLKIKIIHKIKNQMKMMVCFQNEIV